LHFIVVSDFATSEVLVKPGAWLLSFHPSRDSTTAIAASCRASRWHASAPAATPLQIIRVISTRPYWLYLSQNVFHHSFLPETYVQ